jgi:hypothetical protein
LKNLDLITVFFCRRSVIPASFVKYENMEGGQRRPFGLYYEEWLLPGQQPAYICHLCNSKKTFRSIKNHERWFKHKERVSARQDRMVATADAGLGREIGRGDDINMGTLSGGVIGHADVLATLDGGFGSERYEDEIDWRSEGDGEMMALPVPRDDFDDRFSDVSLEGLAEILRGIRHSSPVESDFSSAAPSVWGMGDDIVEPGGDRAVDEADREDERRLGDRGWFPFREKTVSH